MTATELLETLFAHGFRLTPVGEALRLQGPRAALTEDLRQAIRQHKPGLLALLTARAEAADERAAIYEYDGALPGPMATTRWAAHGAVVGLPPCAQCNGMAYCYEDGFVRCTTPWCSAAAAAGGPHTPRGAT